jgi:hypothetical protein
LLKYFFNPTDLGVIMNKTLKTLLSIIALLLLGINIQLYNLYGGNFSLITEAKARERHSHDTYDINSFRYNVESIVEDCSVRGNRISC